MRAKKRVLRMFGVMLNNKDLKIQYVNNRTPFRKFIKKVIKKSRFTSLCKFESGGVKHELYKTSNG